MGGTYLVTGAARGLGLEFCAQLSRAGATVIACPRRDDERALHALAEECPDRVRIVPMDVGDTASIRSAVSTVGALGLDVLINNAGVYPNDGSVGSGVDSAALVEAFRVNAVAPLEVVGAFLPALRRGSSRKIANVTSLMGSIGDNTSGGSYAYRMSKAALNMATMNLAHELTSDRFTVLALHPGWVRTRMGGGGAPLDARSSVAGMLRTIETAGPDDTGGFLSWDGRTLPW